MYWDAAAKPRKRYSSAYWEPQHTDKDICHYRILQDATKWPLRLLITQENISKEWRPLSERTMPFWRVGVTVNAFYLILKAQAVQRNIQRQAERPERAEYPHQIDHWLQQRLKSHSLVRKDLHPNLKALAMSSMSKIQSSWKVSPGFEFRQKAGLERPSNKTLFCYALAQRLIAQHDSETISHSSITLSDNVDNCAYVMFWIYDCMNVLAGM